LYGGLYSNSNKMNDWELLPGTAISSFPCEWPNPVQAGCVAAAGSAFKVSRRV
jgi:hypothetical protein